MKILGFILLVTLLLLTLFAIKILDVAITAIITVFGVMYFAWLVILIFFD